MMMLFVVVVVIAVDVDVITMEVVLIVVAIDVFVVGDDIPTLFWYSVYCSSQILLLSVRRRDSIWSWCNLL